MEYNNINNQHGVILLISIIILSAVTLTTLIIAGLIVREFRLSLDVASSEAAYYAAEAGAEEALWEFNKSGDPPPRTYNGSVDVATYNTVVSGSVQKIEGNLEKDKSKQITIKDVYDIRGIKFTFDDCDDNTWVEITRVSWPRNSIINEENLLVEKTLYSNNRIDDPVVGILDSNNKNYKIRFKPLYSCLDKYTVVACSDSSCDNETNIPGEIDIQSKGTCKDTKRGIQVRMASEPGIIGVFDYVLFSDEPLMK